MNGLQKYLDKYKALAPPETSKCKILAAIIRDECGVTVEEKEISIRGGGVYLKCHPALKGEIRMCAPRILSALHQHHSIHISFIR